jgi:hypothetical protein
VISSYYDAPDIAEGSVTMRGDDRQTGWMFSYVSPEERVPADHPLRAIRRMTDAIFDRLSPLQSTVFDVGSAVDSAREIAPRVVDSGTLHGAK